MRKYLLIAAALTAFCLSASAEKINGTKISSNSTIVGVITDSKTGKGIEGIAVSDGYSYTKTDKHGVYQMAANPKCRVISYVTPSEFKMAQNADGSPTFFAYRDKSKKLDRHDFSLEKMASPEKEFTLFALSDPQCQTDFHVSRFLKEAVPSIEKSANEEIAGGMSVYGVGLGDIIYDNLSIWEPMAENFRSFKTSDGHMPVFNVPGNHDHYNVSESDYDALNNYVKWFGPTEYSFDRGDAHIICMDDIVFLQTRPHKPGKEFTNCVYAAGFTDEQVEWLKADIAQVKDKDRKLLIFCTHAPFAEGREQGGLYVNHDRHYSDVLSLMTVFENAHILIGHTHHPFVYFHDEYVCKGGSPVTEHVLGALCGAWWHADICTDGTPNGFAEFRVKDASIVDVKPVWTNSDSNVQMRVYDGNQVYAGSKGYEFQWEDDLKGKFVASIWYDDDRYWKVDFIQDGKVYPMKRVTRRQNDWNVVSFFINENGRGIDNASYKPKTLHFWTVEAPSGHPAEEKDWEIRAVQTIPGSGIKHVYSCKTLQTGYVGLGMDE